MRQTDTAERVVLALEAEGLLAPEVEDRSRAVVERALLGPRPAAGPAMPKLVEVVAYLGAALVLAAGFLFVIRSWDDLGDVGQVSFLAAVTLVLGAAGAFTVAAQRAVAGSDVRRRLSGTLLTGSALFAAVTVNVAIEVFTDATFSDVYWPGVAAGVVMAAGSAVAYRFSSTAVGLVGMVGGALDVAANLGSGLAPSGDDEAIGVGIAVFTVGAAWALLTELGLFDQRTIARTLAAAVLVFGSQVTSFTDVAWLGYLLSVAVVAVGVWLYLTRQDWPYLAAAVIAVTLVVPEAVSDWTEGSLGVVGGVLVAGITLLLASYAGYRLRRDR
ncbi:MAG TPA: hypothetical protein VHO29_14980 [Marmoricola sp.]|nr:hypothetical protein [Marmoricola sp.]